MKKKTIVLSALLLSASLGVTTVVLSNNTGTIGIAKDEVYWHHYDRVEPTLTKHGSKEFWANCSTHNYTLENPGVYEDIREGVAFDTTSYFDELESDDPRYIPSISEKVDIKGFLEELLDVFAHDPYSYIPESMRPSGVSKVSPSSVNYDFTNFTNVSSIHYGGFGEQWHMVIENIKESERFYNITSYGSEVLALARTVAYAFLDSYDDNTVTKIFDSDTRYISKIDFHDDVLKYNVKFLTGVTIPLFGTIIPQVDMEYDIDNLTKTVRIQLGENNALRFVVTPNAYRFGLEYGIETVSRKAYFEISKDEDEKVEGHIYEYVQYKDKDLVPACADFYIDENYVTAVGNKASGLVGFTNYICELYKTSEGKMLGYEIQETLSSVEYNTLWFNLNNITGISNVKIADDKIYVNNSSTEFKTKKYGGVNLKTASRRFDIEQRLQYFYGEVNEELEELETSIPMMFIQEEKYSDFVNDVHNENTYLNVGVNLASAYLTKIENDYDELVPVFAGHKDSVTSDTIVSYIGNAEIVG